MDSVWPVRVAIGWPVRAFHSRAVWFTRVRGVESAEVARVVLSGLKTTVRTGSGLERVALGSSGWTAHSRAVWSPLAVASRVPSGLNATALTGLVWPARVAVG